MRYTYYQVILAIVLLGTLQETRAQQESITVEVFYDYQTNFFGPGMEYNINSKLTCSHQKSLYEMDHSKKFSSKESNEQSSDNNLVLSFASEGNTFVYKDLTKSEVYFEQNISLAPFYTIDTSPAIAWELTEDTKEILGYQCQRAVGFLGGRLYDAYFTPEISISDGPWRFQGLPGLILEVKSSDGIFSLVGSSLKITKEEPIIENPYAEKEIIKREDFLILYKEKYDQVLRNNMSENGPTQSLAKEGLVKYIID